MNMPKWALSDDRKWKSKFVEFKDYIFDLFLIYYETICVSKVHMLKTSGLLFVHHFTPSRGTSGKR